MNVSTQGEDVMQLGDAIDLFLGQYTTGSKASYKSVLKYLSTKFFSPNRPLNTIEPVNLVQFIAHVDARPEIKSPASYNKYVQTTSTFFNWCVKMELLDKSPAKMLRKRSLRGSVPTSKAMPRKKIARLIEYAGDWEKVKYDPRPLALVRFLADTGCRIGGAATMTREQLFLDSPAILDGSKVYKAELYEKGRPDPNTYYFGIETAIVLRRLLLSHSGDIVFGYKGRSTNGNNLAAYFRKIGKRAGIGSWGPHSLRHAKGHALAEQFPASVGSRVLNNSEKIFVLHYSPKDDEYVQSAASQLFHTNKPSLLPHKSLEETGTDN